MTLGKVTVLKKIGNTFSLINKESKRKNRSLIAIIIEMIRLYVKNSIGPNYYLQAGMADQNMSWDFKCSHISDKDYHAALNKLNPRPYRKITQHKLSEKSFLQFSHIPCAKFIGFLEPVKGFDVNGQNLTTEEQLSSLLQSYVDQTICIKIPEGFGGEGFFAGTLSLDDGTLKVKALDESDTLTIPQVLDRYRKVIATEGLLFESFIEQHDSFAQFNPSSVNTLRVWVLQTGDNVDVIGTYLRIGRAGNLTDNGGGGGIMCPVNLKTGVLDKGLTTSTPFRDEFEQHPDHQAQIFGVQLPFWNDILACAEDTLKKLPYTKFAGLDVAMATTGPLIIEVNVSPDKNGAANGLIRSSLLKIAADKL
jgi:hypothetical protein